MEEPLRILEDNRRDLQENLDVLKDKEQVSHNCNDELERKNEENKTVLQRVDGEIKTLNQGVQLLEKQIEGSHTEKQELHDQQQQCQHKQDRLNKELCVNEEELKQSEEKRHKLEKQENHLEQQHEQFVQRVQPIQHKIEEVSQQIQQTENQLQEFQARSIDLEEKSYQVKLDTQLIQDYVHQFERRLDTLDQERIDTELKMRDQESVHHCFQQKANIIEKFIDMRRNRREEFNASVRRLHTEANEIESEMQITQEKNELNAIEQRIQSFYEKVDHSPSELKTVQDMLFEEEQFVADISQKQHINEFQERKHSDQEKQNTHEKLDCANAELNWNGQEQDILARKVSTVQNKLYQLAESNRLDANELQEHATDLKRQTLLDEEFKKKLRAELEREHGIKQDIEKDEEQIRMIEHKLDESEYREKAARTAEQRDEAAKTRTQLRVQLQQAKTALQTRKAQLKEQSETVSVKMNKVEIQKNTLDGTVSDVSNKLNKLISRRRQVDQQVMSTNEIGQMIQFQLEKEDRILNSDVQQLQESVSSCIQKNQQLNFELEHLKQETYYLDQQYRTELANNQMIVTSPTPRLREQQKDQFENVNAYIIDINKSITAFENELINYQRMLEAVQQQKTMIEEEHAKMEAKLVSYDQEKQAYENQIQCFINNAEEKKCIQNDLEKENIVVKSQTNVKRQELDMQQERKMEHEQELATVLAALADIRCQIVEIDKSKQTLESDIQQQIMAKKENEILARENMNELLAIKKNLERVTRKYNEDQRVYNMTKENCQVLISRADIRRKLQSDIDQKLIQAQVEARARQEEIARLAKKIAEVDRNIRTKRAIHIMTSDPNTYSHQDVRNDEDLSNLHLEKKNFRHH